MVAQIHCSFLHIGIKMSQVLQWVGFFLHYNISCVSLSMDNNGSLMWLIHMGIQCRMDWLPLKKKNGLIKVISRKKSQLNSLEQICLPCWAGKLRSGTGSLQNTESLRVIKLVVEIFQDREESQTDLDGTFQKCETQRTLIPAKCAHRSFWDMNFQQNQEWDRYTSETEL